MKSQSRCLACSKASPNSNQRLMDRGAQLPVPRELTDELGEPSQHQTLDLCRSGYWWIPFISPHSLLTEPGGQNRRHRKWELTFRRSLPRMVGQGLGFRSYNLLSSFLWVLFPSSEGCSVLVGGASLGERLGMPYSSCPGLPVCAGRACWQVSGLWPLARSPGPGRGAILYGIIA